MIAKISRGWRVTGLVAYLMGRGRFNEHTDQRVVAAWDGAPHLHQPPRRADGSFPVTDLTAALAAPAVAAGVSLREPRREPERGPEHPTGRRLPRGPVWHCSLRNHADDRVLTDAQWEQVVTDLMHRTGIAPSGDLGGCRWVAIRHAPDHVHVAAVLVRQDNGRRVHPRQDYLRARDGCRAAEQALGLTPTAAADRTAVAPSTRAELEKAARRGHGEPGREWLRRTARVAAVQTRDPAGYLRRLTELGVRVRPRHTLDGRLVGYAVADPDPGGATTAGDPVWFSGRTLARDLALPQLLARWASAPAPPTPIPPAPTEHSVIGRAERTAAVSGAVAALERATAAVAAVAAGHEVGEDPAGIAHSAADLTVAMRAVLAPTAAADAAARAEGLYDRAARQARVGQPRVFGPRAAQLRTAAWRLAAIRGLNDRLGGDAGIVPLIVAVAALIAEIAAHHERRQCPAQAGAARAAAAVWRRHRTGAAHAPTATGPAAQLRPGPRPIPSPNRASRPNRGTGPFPPPVIPRGARTPGPTRGPRRSR